MSVLFMLPKSIVSNSNKTVVSKEAVVNNSISEADIKKIIIERNNFYQHTDIKKRYIFANSLAKIFIKSGFIDSIDVYAGEIALSQTGNYKWILAGDLFYNLLDETENELYIQKINEYILKYYSEYLKNDTANAEIKAKIAMSYTTSSTPMQAVMILRNVLNNNPNQATAIYNLGKLSLKSGQYDKAIQRFKDVIALNDTNWYAHYYLGVSYLLTSNKNEALSEFDKVINYSNNKDLISKTKKSINNIN
ncbi:MAG: tetratricopeptide repeat protein [Cytophagales bacterium]|nr:tetratricopeptide repeat protein [Cytophagales bacterium]